jgi:hypothetical protein
MLFYSFAEDVLTIIANQGIHVLGGKYLRGEVFAASTGSLNFTNTRSITAEYQRILSRTARKLKERPWRKVYIVPFGPTTLSMQIKLLVYRICGVESIDVAHLGGNMRADVALNLRQIAETAKDGIRRPKPLPK